MKRFVFTLVGFCLLHACVVPRAVDRLQDNCPPPEFGRPGWVRACAGTGAWTGALVGGVASIVLLPVTYPLSLLAGGAFTESSTEEFLFAPALGCAAAGHFLLGGVPDVIDHVFRRAWVDEALPASSFELVPVQPPMPAGAMAPESAAPAAGQQPPAKGNE